MSNDYPKWMCEMERYLSVKKLFLLYGNIYDKIPFPIPNVSDKYEYLPLREVLKKFFFHKGYTVAGFFDKVDGLTMFKREDENNKDVQRKDISSVLDIIRGSMSKEDTPSFFVIDYSSHLCQRPDQIEEEESKVFLKILKCVQDAKQPNVGDADYNNILILICDKVNDIPAWLYLNNPEAKTLLIEKPDLEDRKHYISQNIHAFKGGGEIPKDNEKMAVNLLADLTDGMCIVEIASLSTISRNENISIVSEKSVISEREFEKIVNKYKYGVTESKWQRDLLRDKLKTAKGIFEKRVMGQEQAINAVLDIIKRAGMGLSGVQHSSSSSKPRGILFFAGPTGVGKTELAKTLSGVLFGGEDLNHEKSFHRFDMSEYSSQHADQKLLGAPPGYVGYESGGQLTNKIKEQPFSVLLFDEIEKAHPSILDKFLQILEDGRMTDGKGETVYFSESVIIFTSNIGTYVEKTARDENNRIVGNDRVRNIYPTGMKCKKCGFIEMSVDNPEVCGKEKCGGRDFEKVETPYSLIKKKIMDAISEHFNYSLKRPEILNRLGDNFVVFDYIRPPVMKLIIESILNKIKDEVYEKHVINISFSDEVKDWILKKASENIEHGGRGVGNNIEKVIVNPLARKLWDEDVKKGESLVIKGIKDETTDSGEWYVLET